MKIRLKFIFAIIILVILTAFTAGCGDKENYYEQYFNDFDSQNAFTSAESMLNLAKTVSVYAYDGKNAVFVTKKLVTNQYADSEDDNIMALFGFASVDEEYQTPIYSNIVSINGDYAIVTKPYVYFDDESNETTMVDIIGVVKFRGANKGDKTEFSNLNCKYMDGYFQFKFVGDYIVCPNSKVYPNYRVNYSTFYSYKEKDKLFEEFRVACGSAYELSLYDDILVATKANYAYFYALDSLAQNGYLQLTEYDTFKAFPEDTSDNYADSTEVSVNYLGNGLFVRTAKITSEYEFEGYNIIFEDVDETSTEAKYVYGRVKSDLYNFYSKKTSDYEWLLVDSVANKYTLNTYRNTVDSLNNTPIADAENDRYEYSLPFLNPATFVKDGYSIVYFYYFPNMDEGDFNYSISFCLIDGNGKIIRIEDLLMPPKFTDGIGLQNVDPIYDMLLGDVQYTTYGNKTITLEEIGDNYTFENSYYQNDAIIVCKYDFDKSTKLYGAVEISSKRQITEYKYIELTPFYGDYAIGVTEDNGVYTYYSINKNGEEVQINKVVNIRQGVYIYASSVGKMGLKNYNGDVLIDALYDNLEILETFENDGTQKSYAVATSGSNTYIYAIS